MLKTEIWFENWAEASRLNLKFVCLFNRYSTKIGSSNPLVLFKFEFWALCSIFFFSLCFSVIRLSFGDSVSIVFCGHCFEVRFQHKFIFIVFSLFKLFHCFTAYAAYLLFFGTQNFESLIKFQFFHYRNLDFN